MKRTYNIAISFLAMLILSVSCADMEGTSNVKGFSVDKDEINMNAEGGAETVRITSSTSWSAEVTEPWIFFSPSNGNGTEDCKVVIDSSVLSGPRDAFIRITTKEKGVQPIKISVTQFGFSKVILPSKEEIEIENSEVLEKRFIYADLKTNVRKFTVEFQNEEGDRITWLTTKRKSIEPELQYGDRPQPVRLKIDWQSNTEPDVRIAKVVFNSEELDEPSSFKVKQKPAPRITDDRAGDSLALCIIMQKLSPLGDAWDTSESMRNWESVTLWEEGDELPGNDKNAIGRVRTASFMLFAINETLPSEVKHLRYIEKLNFYSNVNTMWKNIKLGPDICELKHLKHLTIGAYGLVELPKEFVKLGSSLEVLDLNANNFSDIPSILTPENFPKLTHLSLLGNRRWSCTDLRDEHNAKYTDGLGLHIDTRENESVKRLFTWEKLEELRLNVNYIEGPIPDFKVGEVFDGKTIEAYSAEDIKEHGDTLKWLVDDPKGQTIPKILPNMKRLSINLNFFTGDVPDWILYHPHLMDWAPTLLVFPQWEKSIDSKGHPVGLQHAPTTFDYYYGPDGAYPLYQSKYEFHDVIED